MKSDRERYDRALILLGAMTIQYAARRKTNHQTGVITTPKEELLLEKATEFLNDPQVGQDSLRAIERSEEQRIMASRPN